MAVLIGTVDISIIHRGTYLLYTICRSTILSNIYYLNQNSQAVKKECGPQKKPG